MLWSKLLVIAVMIGILYALFSAAYYLRQATPGDRRLVIALTWRISLSLILFFFLFFAFYMGWLHPHNLIT